MKELLNIDFGNVDLIDGVLKCSKCGDKIISPKLAQNLQNHLTTIIGFVEYHKKC